MTICLGMRVAEGLVGIADTRVTSGSEVITARKVSVHEHGGRNLFLRPRGELQLVARATAAIGDRPALRLAGGCFGFSDVRR